MHIGFLTPEYVIPPDRVVGGLANYLKKVALALTDKGHEVTIIVLSDHNASWKDGSVNIHEMKRVAFPQWIYWCKFLNPIISVSEQYLSSKRVSKMVLDIQNKKPFDIIQTSSYMVPGYSLLNNKRIPIVCRISSYSPICRSVLGRQRSFGEYLTDWLESQQTLKSARSFAPSNCIAEIFSDYEGYKPDVIKTLLEMPDNSALDDSFYNEHLSGKQYLLYFGSLNFIKGVDIIIESLPKILNRHRDLSIVFIGRDDKLPSGKKCVDEILTQKENFNDQIFYHAPITKDLLYPVISHAQGVLMPSRIDNYPNACLEAQSMGIPVIGTYNSSLDEMIINKKTGFLIKNGSLEGLIIAIECLLGLSEAKMQKMRQDILDHVQSSLLEESVGPLIEWYQSVIEEYHH